MAPYRKIQTRIWNDAKFISLSEPGKLVFLFLLSHPSMTMLGAMRATTPGLATELRMDQKRFREAFGEGFAKGMVKHDEEAACVWLPNFLRYNRPDNPNIVKSWPEALELIPECQLKNELCQHLREYSEGLPEPFRKAFAERFMEPFPNGMPIQEQEQEQEIYMPSSPSAPKRPSKPTTEQVIEIIGIWNRTAEEQHLPKAKLTPEREKKIRSRLKDSGWLEDFVGACKFVASDAFSCGKNDRGWKAGLDYMLRPGKATELAERAKSQCLPLRSTSESGDENSLTRNVERELAAAAAGECGR